MRDFPAVMSGADKKTPYGSFAADAGGACHTPGPSTTAAPRTSPTRRARPPAAFSLRLNTPPSSLLLPALGGLALKLAQARPSGITLGFGTLDSAPVGADRFELGLGLFNGLLALSARNRTVGNSGVERSDELACRLLHFR